ncbi:bifunctional nuclease family protein [Candidatus Sumerlaeota bacterium]|nr:bifunctional nuclease family protein [Candidatus Sumerlaeota bacterium]
MFVEMELAEIQMSEVINHHQIIILSEKGGTRAFPVFIGFYEASAMELSIKKYQTPRPMTHDLIFNILDAFHLDLVRVLIDDLRNDTFFGKLVIRKDGEEDESLIDTRPSDAIVLASKRGIPIFVEEDVLNQVTRAADQEDENQEPPSPEDAF